MEKLIVTLPSEKVTWTPMNIDNTTHELLKRLSKETGLPMTRIVSESVRFCADRIEVVYE